MKRRLRRACAQCQKAHASCDQDRPCGRCVKYNITSLCFDTELKKRGRKPGSAANRTKAAANINTEDIEEGVFPLDLNDQLDDGNPHASHNLEPYDDFDENNPEEEFDADDSGNYPHPRGDIHLMRPTLREATNALTLRQPSQPIRENDIRALIDQIKELKANQKLLREELRALKDEQLMSANDSRINPLLLGSSPGRRALLMQNATSTPSADTLNSAINGTSSTSALESSSSSEEISDKAWVIYDLTKLPPTVRTANSTFCKMLGYEMNEVIGQPWKKFVHPDYYERALQILSARRLNNSLHQPIEFEQVYVHKNGGVFLTIDSHTIVILEGQPVSDVVSIRLAPAPAPVSSAASSSSASSSATPKSTKNTKSVRGASGARKGMLQDAHELPVTPKRTAPKSARAQQHQPNFDEFDSSIIRSRPARTASGDDEFSDFAQRKLEDLSLENRTARTTRSRQPSGNVFSHPVAKSAARKPPPRSAKRAAVEVIQKSATADADSDIEADPYLLLDEQQQQQQQQPHPQPQPPVELLSENPLSPGGTLLNDTSASSSTNLTANGLASIHTFDPTLSPQPAASASAPDVVLYPTAGAPASPSSQLFSFDNDWLNDVVVPPPLSANAAGSSSLSLLSPPLLPAGGNGGAGAATSSPLRVGLKESADELATSFNIDDVLSGFLDDQQNGNSGNGNSAPVNNVPSTPPIVAADANVNSTR